MALLMFLHLCKDLKKAEGGPQVVVDDLMGGKKMARDSLRTRFSIEIEVRGEGCLGIFLIIILKISQYIVKGASGGFLRETPGG